MTLHQIKGQRPDFGVLIGWEELLCTALSMGADGATLACADIAPEIVMTIYEHSHIENQAEARRLQFKLLDLFSFMVGAPNFPKGFRAGYELPGVKAGHARFPLSADEHTAIEAMRTQLAIVLADASLADKRGV